MKNLIFASLFVLAGIVLLVGQETAQKQQQPPPPERQVILKSAPPGFFTPENFLPTADQMKDEMARACGRWKDVKEQVDACTSGWIQGFAYRGRWFVPPPNAKMPSFSKENK